MRISTWIVIFTLVMLATSCASHSPLQRKNVKNPEGDKGTFTLYIMQENAGSQGAKAAIAEREGDGVALVPAVSGYDLKTYKGLSLSHAIETSRAAFSIHCAYTGHMLRGLIADNGDTVAYEIVPDYTRFICESAPSVYINYFDMGGGRIRAVLSIMGKVEDNPLRPEHRTATQ